MVYPGRRHMPPGLAPATAHASAALLERCRHFLSDSLRRILAASPAFFVAAAVLVLAALALCAAAPSSQRNCAYCGEPITGSHLEQNGKAYHRACWEDHVALRCSLCGGIIQGEYLKDAWGNRYHPSHRKETVECEYCGRFISENVTQGGVRYADGRNVCNICRRTAVDGAGEGRKLVAGAAARLDKIGLKVDPSRVRLELVDLRRMAEVSGDRSRLRTGYTHYEWETSGDGERRTETVTVYVLIGMPRIETIGTLAHELSHVWLSRADRFDTRPALAEGSCNYAAMRVLQTYPGPESAHHVEKMRSSDDPAYGEGLRRVIRFVDRNGVEAWLDLVRRRNDFPPGF